MPFYPRFILGTLAFTLSARDPALTPALAPSLIAGALQATLPNPLSTFSASRRNGNLPPLVPMPSNFSPRDPSPPFSASSSPQHTTSPVGCSLPEPSFRT